jgi:hypothetical protein
LPDGQFDWTALNARLQSAFDDASSGVPASAANTPIYVILTGPGVPSGAGWNGYNETSAATSNRRQVWIRVDPGGPSGSFDEDRFTLVLSHELVESMSGAVKVNLPGAFARLGNQVADGEPEVGYGYRLNGVLVQPYWSNQDQAFIVPDGNRQQFTLDVTAPGPFGPPGFRLSVRGDRPRATRNGQVRIGREASGSVWVALSGEVARFDAGVISSIAVTAGGGKASVRVVRVAAGSSGNASQNRATPFKLVEANGGILSTSSPTFPKGAANVRRRRGLLLLVYDRRKRPIVRRFLSNGDGKFRIVVRVLGNGSAVLS